MIITKVITTILPQTEQGREYAARMQKYLELTSWTVTDRTIELTETVRFNFEEIKE